MCICDMIVIIFTFQLLFNNNREKGFFFYSKWNIIESFKLFNYIHTNNYYCIDKDWDFRLGSNSKYSVFTPWYVTGICDGEGSFQSEISINKNNNLKVLINFSLQIKQNSHDVAVLNAIKKFFAYGYLKPKYNIRNIDDSENSLRKTTALWIRNTEIICKFFDKYPLYTIKKLDYLDWKRLINLKSKNAHLNNEGLNLMKNIKNNMNANRFKNSS